MVEVVEQIRSTELSGTIKVLCKCPGGDPCMSVSMKIYSWTLVKVLDVCLTLKSVDVFYLMSSFLREFAEHPDADSNAFSYVAMCYIMTKEFTCTSQCPPNTCIITLLMIGNMLRVISAQT